MSCHASLCGRTKAPKMVLCFTSGVKEVPHLASAEAFVEFEKEGRMIIYRHHLNRPKEQSDFVST